MISCWVDQSRDSRVSEHRDSRLGMAGESKEGSNLGVHVSHLNLQDLGSRRGTHVSTKLKYKQLTRVSLSTPESKANTSSPDRHLLSIGLQRTSARREVSPPYRPKKQSRSDQEAIKKRSRRDPEGDTPLPSHHTLPPPRPVIKHSNS
jgi:hypothetical protein